MKAHVLISPRPAHAEHVLYGACAPDAPPSRVVLLCLLSRRFSCTPISSSLRRCSRTMFFMSRYCPLPERSPGVAERQEEEEGPADEDAATRSLRNPPQFLIHSSSVLGLLVEKTSCSTPSPASTPFLNPPPLFTFLRSTTRALERALASSPTPSPRKRKRLPPLLFLPFTRDMVLHRTR